MPYELCIPGSPPARYDDEQAALKAAAAALSLDRTARVSVIDLATGRPASLGERRNWHEEHRKKLGF